MYTFVWPGKPDGNPGAKEVGIMDLFAWFRKNRGKAPAEGVRSSGAQVISTSLKASKQWIDEQFYCPKCNRFISERTPRHGVLYCPCGCTVRIENYQVVGS